MSQPYASPSPLPGPSSHTYYSSPPPPQAPEFYHQYPASPQRGRSNHSQNRGRGRRQGPYAPAPHGRAYYPPPPPQPSHPYPQTAWHPQAYAHYAPPANYHPYPNHSYPLPESIPASSITTSPAPPVTSPLSSSRDLERPSSVAETNATSISIPSQPPQPTSSESIPVEQTPDELPKASEDRVEENALETHPDASFEDGENPGPLLIPEWCISKIKLVPSDAFGLTISPKANPPLDVVERALPPPPSLPKKKKSTKSEFVYSESKSSSTPEPESVTTEDPAGPTPSYEPSSSAVTESTLHTSIPTSPVSTNTSLSLSSPAVKSGINTPAKGATSTKKSWASLLKPEDASSSGAPPKGPNSLPISSVVGYSSAPSTASTPPPVLSIHSQEVLKLLASKPPAGLIAAAPKLQTRGIVNLGNLCFANTILQVLSFTSPFRHLFEELGRLLSHDALNANGELPLLRATIEFLKEFVPVPPTKQDSTGKDDREDQTGAFVPNYFYDALREKKRFDSMRRGHQEDAEEFLGFYLDTLEEELLGLSSSLNSDSGSAESKPNAVEEEQEDAPAEEGWSEVGKRNRVIVTRTVKSMDTAISRIFGGTSRSTIRRPGTHDSVIVEDWRHLGLDIQPENVKTIEDALRNLSRPETVQVTSPQSGTLIDASKQYLVDSLPPILVLHLKRFHYDSVAKDVVKIRKNVRLSPELEFPDESIVSAHRGRSTTRYKLYGVLYHHGLSATGGHYTLDICHAGKTREAWNRGWKEEWIRIDDEFVSDLQPRDVFDISTESDDRVAYLLFYRQIVTSTRV